MQKSNDAGKPRPHRRDSDSLVLLVLDESIQVGPVNLVDSSLARLSTKVEKEHDRCKGTLGVFGLSFRRNLGRI
jgi:hypothetical protein